MAENDGEGAETIPPLRKRKPDQTLYTRRPETLQLLAGLLELPEREVPERAAITRRSAPGWLRGECLVFMMRRASRRGDKRSYQRWCRLLLERVRAQMPHGRSGTPLTTLELAMAEYGVDRFAKLLGPDLSGYNESLDIYEAVFDLALARLRTDALKTTLPKRDDTKPKPTYVEYGSDPRVDLEVEQAKAEEDLFGIARGNDEDFRLRAWEAIDALPTEQNRILTMMREGVPPGEMAKILGLEPKTLYNRKMAALKAVRDAIGSAGQ
ncbi:putative Response regulator receiver protein [Sphingomonas sp. EC-HK361]|uniref:RNA polymerase sigma factor n=1 Tax=Sphingomonas sp. EC-HK361 TaxID=2038397 RepID=UPI001257E3CC|nr:sigma factor-like helix-turn-helix DNA-binding protein [Sphingomonas sp. EC-HK361]VVT24035.1 putative Response regulator receiver protein [Sphingomonas sp. EC-HK361]